MNITTFNPIIALIRQPHPTITQYSSNIACNTQRNVLKYRNIKLAIAINWRGKGDAVNGQG